MKQKHSGGPSSQAVLFIDFTLLNSSISGLDVGPFLASFRKWGPNARTCLWLARLNISEVGLQNKAAAAARDFAHDPTAIDWRTLSQDVSHTLFTVTPNDDNRLDFTLRVSTPYLCGLVVQEMVRLDAAARASFHHKASTLPHFRGTWGYMFEIYFLAWLYSATPGDVLPCTAKSSATPAQPPTISTSSQALTASSSARPLTPAQPIRWSTRIEDKKLTREPEASDQAKLRQKTRRRVQTQVKLRKKTRLEPQVGSVELHIKALGQDKTVVNSGDSDFKKAKDSDTPRCWVPQSRAFPSFDAVICTKEKIITLQLTVASTHTMKPDGFERLKENLPEIFENKRSWCHVFVTDLEKNPISLRQQNHGIAVEKNISIYTAVFDVFGCKFSPEDMERAFPPIVCSYTSYFNDFGTHLIRVTLLQWARVGRR
jgi:hypothetical protein